MRLWQIVDSLKAIPPQFAKSQAHLSSDLGYLGMHGPLELKPIFTVKRNMPYPKNLSERLRLVALRKLMTMKCLTSVGGNLVFLGRLTALSLLPHLGMQCPSMASSCKQQSWSANLDWMTRCGSKWEPLESRILCKVAPEKPNFPHGQCF